MRNLSLRGIKTNPLARELATSEGTRPYLDCLIKAYRDSAVGLEAAPEVFSDLSLEKRYHHASEMKADLQRLKRDTESGKATASSTAVPHWSRRTTFIGAVAFVFIIALIAIAAFDLGRSGHAPINSVAVLPFSNASDDPNTEYLSYGITEGVIDRLSGLPNLKVISRSSAFRYKQRDVEPQRVAKELGVEALVVNCDCTGFGGGLFDLTLHDSDECKAFCFWAVLSYCAFSPC